MDSTNSLPANFVASKTSSALSLRNGYHKILGDVKCSNNSRNIKLIFSNRAHGNHKFFVPQAGQSYGADLLF